MAVAGLNELLRKVLLGLECWQFSAK